MSTFTGKKIANTYKDLLKINTSVDNAGIDGTLRNIQDGNGVNTALSLSQNETKVNGNLTVTGSQTVVSKDTISVADPMMVLGAGAASGSSDAGLLIDRGSDTNVAFIWDESEDQFAVVYTADIDNSTDDITISSYSDLRVNNLNSRDDVIELLSKNNIPSIESKFSQLGITI